MSSSANLQNLLVNVFRPVYTYDPISNVYAVKVELSNLDTITANALNVGTFGVGDSNSNVFVGSNAGLGARSSFNNTAVGYSAGNSMAYVSNSVYLGFGAGANVTGFVDSPVTDVIAIGANTSGKGVSNIYIGSSTAADSAITSTGNIFIGHNIQVGDVSHKLLIGNSSRITIAGDLSKGWVGIGGIRTPTYAYDSLDVSGYAVVTRGLGLGLADPSGYTLNVSGTAMFKDGSYTTTINASNTGILTQGVYPKIAVKDPGATYPTFLFQDVSSGTMGIRSSESTLAMGLYGSRHIDISTSGSNIQLSTGGILRAKIDGCGLIVYGDISVTGGFSTGSTLGNGFYGGVLLSNSNVTTANGSNLIGGVTLNNSNISNLGNLNLSGAIVSSTVNISNQIGGVTLSNNNISYSGTITGSTVNSSNRIGGVTLSNNDISYSGRIIGSTVNSSNVIGGVTLSNGILRGSDGTFNAPAYTFANDLSTGIHLIGTSQLGFDTSGVQRMCISGNRVGINCNSPLYSLDVSGDIRATSNIVSSFFSSTLPIGTVTYPPYSINGDSTTGLIFPASCNVGLQTNGTEKLRVLSNGNVGIGTPSPGSTLDVSGSIRYSGNLIGASGSVLNTTDNFIVAGGSGTNTIAYSVDAINWTAASTSGIFTAVYGIAWNGSLWVAVGQGTHSIATSPDGINWTGRTTTTIFSTYGAGVAWNGRLWVAVGVGTNTIATSPDGINWTGRGTSIFSSSGNGIAWNGSLWVAVGSGTNSIASSVDGITWTGRSTIFSVFGSGVAWNGSLWVAVGYDGTNTFATSTDGITWTGQGTGPFTTAGLGIAWNGSVWVAAGQGDHSLAYSTNGTSWTGVTSTTIFGTYGASVAWNGNFWVAVGIGSTDTIATSVDGINWVARGKTAFTSQGRSVASRRVLPFVGNSQVIPTIIRAQNGSSNIPSYTFINDASTGIHLIGTSQLGFDTSGVQRMVISNSNVGIGTSPAVNMALDVSGNIRGTSVSVTRGGSGVIDGQGAAIQFSGGNITFTSTNGFVTSTNGFYANNGTSGFPSHSFTNDSSTGIHLAGTSQLAFDTSGIQRMVISNARVGIGLSSPGYTLDVSGTINANSNISIVSPTSNISVSVLDQTNNNTNSIALYQNATAGGQGIYTNSSIPISINLSGIARLTITSNDINIANRFAIQSGTANAPQVVNINDVSSGLWFPGTNQLALSTAGVERMRISNANVGIGTTAPATRLDVSGTIQARDFSFPSTDTSSTLLKFQIPFGLFVRNAAPVNAVNFLNYTGSATRDASFVTSDFIVLAGGTKITFFSQTGGGGSTVNTFCNGTGFYNTSPYGLTSSANSYRLQFINE